MAGPLGRIERLRDEARAKLREHLSDRDRAETVGRVEAYSSAIRIVLSDPDALDHLTRMLVARRVPMHSDRR